MRQLINAILDDAAMVLPAVVLFGVLFTGPVHLIVQL